MKTQVYIESAGRKNEYNFFMKLLKTKISSFSRVILAFLALSVFLCFKQEQNSEKGLSYSKHI